MPYCPECGAETGEGDAYCRSCGSALDRSPDEPAADKVVTDGAVTAETSTAELADSTAPEDDNSSLQRLGTIVLALVFGTLAGFLAGWATQNIGGTGVFFLLTWGVVVIYLILKDSISEAIGSGLYICALLLPLVPIGFYLPMAFGAEGPGSGLVAASSFVALIIWLFIFVTIAGVASGLGYFFKRRADRS